MRSLPRRQLPSSFARGQFAECAVAGSSECLPVCRSNFLENSMKFGKKASLSLLACAALGVVGGAQAAGVCVGTCNLWTNGSSWTVEGATYTQMPDQPTGTGFIDSFVRVGGANMPIVKGYNTTVNGVFQNLSDDTFNHQITVGQVGVVTVGGVNVMRFLLDINQISAGNGAKLNLDDVQIFISTKANQSVTTFTGTEGQIGAGQHSAGRQCAGQQCRGPQDKRRDAPFR